MNKIDLIIDAFECAVADDMYELGKYETALAAARELRDMKPVGEIISEDLGKPFNAMQIRTHFYDFAPPIGTKLYTLGDANE